MFLPSLLEQEHASCDLRNLASHLLLPGHFSTLNLERIFTHSPYGLDRRPLILNVMQTLCALPHLLCRHLYSSSCSHSYIIGDPLQKHIIWPARAWHVSIIERLHSIPLCPVSVLLQGLHVPYIRKRCSVSCPDFCMAGMHLKSQHR